MRRLEAPIFAAQPWLRAKENGRSGNNRESLTIEFESYDIDSTRRQGNHRFRFSSWLHSKEVLPDNPDFWGAVVEKLCAKELLG